MRTRLAVHLVDRDGSPAKGAAIRVAVIMKVKQHRVWYSGPTDDRGKLEIMDVVVQEHCVRHIEMFPEVWTGLSEDTVEEVRVEIPTVEQVHRAAQELDRDDLAECHRVMAHAGPLRFADRPFDLSPEVVASFGEGLVNGFDGYRKLEQQIRLRRRNG